MTALPLLVALSLAQANAPAVAPETLLSVAKAESGFDPLTVHDNQTGRSYRLESKAAALAIIDRLERWGHDYDVGFMQINRRNFAWLGLTPETALDPAVSIEAGGRVLIEGYQRAKISGNEQASILRAASIYNSGNPFKGFASGYVERVQLAADYVVPAIQRARAAAAAAPTESFTPDPPPAPPAPPPEAQDLLHNGVKEGEVSDDMFHPEQPDIAPVSTPNSAREAVLHHATPVKSNGV